MGEPLKIERIEDMSRLSWLEHVITEASLMTRSIRLHSILMNWMCFPLQVWGGFAPPAKNWAVLGGSAPQPKSKNFEKNSRGLSSRCTIICELPLVKAGKVHRSSWSLLLPLEVRQGLVQVPT